MRTKTENLNNAASIDGGKRIGNAPICQFGPGGDFVEVYPAGAKCLSDRPADEPAGLNQLAGKDDLEIPLVSFGPGGIKFTQADQDVQSENEPLFNGDAGLLLQRRSGSGGPSLSERIAAFRSSFTTAFKQLSKADKELPKQVITENSASLTDVAMQVGAAFRIAAGKGPIGLPPTGQYAVAAACDNKEHENADCHAQTIGDTSLNSQLPKPLRLFPDDAGDWECSKPNQSNRIRTRRGVRKKRTASAGSQAQGSLFTGF